MAERHEQSAFPTEATYLRDRGMSLRDYFAAAAFQAIGYRMDSIERNWTPEVLAKTAYEIADAMLAERGGGK